MSRTKWFAPPTTVAAGPVRAFDQGSRFDSGQIPVAIVEVIVFA